MTEAAERRSAPRIAAQAFGNVCLGVAIGLLGYYAVTDVFAVGRQRALAAELPVHVAEAPLPQAPAVSEPADFDLQGWEAEDEAYWNGLDQGEPFGRIVAPAMGLDSVVVKGTSRSDLMKGPGWIDWTDLPGPTGNVGISGHRTTYGAPFRRLDRLSKGDVVTVFSPYRAYTYRVMRLFEVTPDKVEVVASTDEPTLTLTACHPPYSARLRLIAQARLVSVQRLDEAPGAEEVR